MSRPKTSTDAMIAVKLAALRDALRPFVEHAEALRRGDRTGAARKVVYEAGRHELTLGDFDVAAKALSGEMADETLR